MKNILIDFFTSQMYFWQAFIWLFIGTFIGFLVGAINNKEKREERKSAKGLLKFRKKMIERVVKRVLDEINDECKLYSKTFNILWGAEGKVRVFVYAKTKYKKDTAYVKFYVGADENTVAKWAPVYVYEITPIAGAEYWREQERDTIVDDMKNEYYKLLRRYL